jgi:hypothetical protein
LELLAMAVAIGVGVGGTVPAAAPTISVVVASTVPALVFADMRPVLPSAAEAGIAIVTLNAPDVVAAKVVRTAPL